jgi:hypothetical protein
MKVKTTAEDLDEIPPASGLERLVIRFFKSLRPDMHRT